MAINEILFMTKTKLMLLAIFMVLSLPLYVSVNCSSSVKPCGINLANAFEVFLIAYILACVIGEIYSFIRKGKAKKS